MIVINYGVDLARYYFRFAKRERKFVIWCVCVCGVCCGYVFFGGMIFIKV